MRSIRLWVGVAAALGMGLFLFVQRQVVAKLADERKTDREAISAVLRAQQTAWNRGDLDAFLDLEFRFLGPDAALVLGKWHLQREKDELGGVFTLVWQRFPEGWKIIHDHTSAVVPAKSNP